MIYDRQWFLDVRAKLDEASSLKQTPPQNVVEPAEKPTHVWSEEHHCYVLSSDDYDAGMYAGFVNPDAACASPAGDRTPVQIARGETFTVTSHCSFRPQRSKRQIAQQFAQLMGKF